MVHVRAQYPHLATVSVGPAPAGHGKSICDGEFGVLRELRKQVAESEEVEEIPEYVAKLQERADELFERAPAANPKRVMIDFHPPPKAELRKTVLDTAALRRQGMAIRGTPWLSSTQEGATTTFGERKM